MRERKKTECTCQFPGCLKKKYWAYRKDSKSCCPAHRTARWRIRFNEKHKSISLNVRNPRDSSELLVIKKKLVVILEVVLECEKIGHVRLVGVKKLLDKLDTTINDWHENKKKHLIQEQIEWIWEHILSHLYILFNAGKKDGKELCFFTLTSEKRNMIYKLIKAA